MVGQIAEAHPCIKLEDEGAQCHNRSIGVVNTWDKPEARPLAEEPEEEGLLLPDAHDAVGPAAAREGEGEVSASLLRYLGLPAGASPGEIGAAIAAELADGASSARHVVYWPSTADEEAEEHQKEVRADTGDNTVGPAQTAELEQELLAVPQAPAQWEYVCV